MKIFINRKLVNGPWGGGNNFVHALNKYAKLFGHEVVNTFSDDIDIIHIQDVHADALGVDANICLKYKEYNPKVKIVHRINDLDEGRHNSPRWREEAYIHYSKYFNGSIFVSDWVKNFYLEKEWKCKETIVIPNGVEKETFKPRQKLNNKINIVTHHWSTNSGKGFYIYEKIDEFVSNNKEYTFTYIGRKPGELPNTNYISPLFGKELGEELSKYNVYVSASEMECCPNHILESLSCDIPTYAISTSGASSEFTGKDYIFENWKDLEKILLSKNFKNNSYKPKSWQTIIEKYCNFYRKIIENDN